jgi:hypothetical protein
MALLAQLVEVVVVAATILEQAELRQVTAKLPTQH